MMAASAIANSMRRATLSALATLPLAYPFAASMHDLGLLALLGVVQLTIPCLLVVRLARELPAAEIALLGLLEVIFGVTWAWLGAAWHANAVRISFMVPRCARRQRRRVPCTLAASGRRGLLTACAAP